MSDAIISSDDPARFITAVLAIRIEDLPEKFDPKEALHLLRAIKHIEEVTTTLKNLLKHDVEMNGLVIEDEEGMVWKQIRVVQNRVRQHQAVIEAMRDDNVDPEGHLSINVNGIRDAFEAYGRNPKSFIRRMRVSGFIKEERRDRFKWIKSDESKKKKA